VEDLARNWQLETGLDFLNHGSFGACPSEVLDEQRRLQAEMERQPVTFFVRRLQARLDAARSRLAEFVGADPEGIVFVSSVTIGINAVLRSLQRGCHTVPPDKDRGGASPSKRLERPGRSVSFFAKPVFPDPEEDLAGYLSVIHSHPRFLVERWLEHAARDDVERRLVAGNTPSRMVLRPRGGRADAAGLADALRAEKVVSGVLVREQGRDVVEVAPGAEGVMSGKAFKRGLFSVQAVAQMEAAEILDPQPGETVWDACAAPGGKATQLAELMGDEGRVIATDIQAKRLSRLSDNVARLGFESVTIAAFDVLSEGPPPGKPDAGFDAILLDAPCSNTAVLASRPEARWRLRPETFEHMGEMQQRLLAAVRPHLATGGRLIYSTCSLEPEEGRAHGLAPTRSRLVWRAEA
jgi:16S rRNA (cytosine967-C5)-methyltransferase